jgi:hypothetical protein
MEAKASKSIIEKTAFSFMVYVSAPFESGMPAGY